MTYRVYFRNPDGQDQEVGRVEADGKVYQDEYVGRVDLITCKIYQSTASGEVYVGRVNPDTGKVNRHMVQALDAHVGEVRRDGKLYQHRPIARDKEVGYVVPPSAERELAGAGFLLLIVPKLPAPTSNEG